MEYTDACSYRPTYNPAFLAKVREKRAQEQKEAKARKLAEKVRREQEAKEAARRRLEEAYQAAEMARERAQAEAAEVARRVQEALLAKKAVITAKYGSEDARHIIMEVAIAHGVSYEDILGRSRARHLVAARHEAIYEVRKRRPHLSLPQIGRIFKRDHTTILHALRRMERKQESHHDTILKGERL